MTCTNDPYSFVTSTLNGSLVSCQMPKNNLINVRLVSCKPHLWSVRSAISNKRTHKLAQPYHQLHLLIHNLYLFAARNQKIISKPVYFWDITGANLRLTVT
jgi:hypothetical protein